MSLFQIFPMNETGRDFVVGDIHGCFDKLHAELKRVDFKEEVDRLFSVGDLVDRGPYSEEAVEWIGYPWFHAVRGNHEQMAIGVASGKHDRGNYYANGGGWFLELPSERQREIANVFATLPLAIEVETSQGRIGIIHAEVPEGDWDWFRAQLGKNLSNNARNKLFETALWARDKITIDETSDVSGVTSVYVGHTPVSQPRVLGNVHYIDTGAVYQRYLTLVEIT